MTYIYLFKAPGMMYAGQHRCPDTRDPMKDWYMGSGRKWCEYLDENGWHKIKEFRKHVERIILEVIYDEDRDKVGDAEKKWIAYVKENYPDAICNISSGSNPSWSYDTVEEAEEGKRKSNKNYYINNKKKIIAKVKVYGLNHKEEKKSYDKNYRSNPDYNPKTKVNHWGNYHNWPEPSKSNFPPSWNEKDKQDYLRQYNYHNK